ncbi:DUF2120 family protein [Methanocaldococcus infernus]
MWKSEVGKLMMRLKAFRGCRPLFECDDMLIVKGVCRDQVDNIKSYLEEKLKEENFEIVEDEEEIKEFVESIHERLRGGEEYLDPFGFEKMKEAFKITGFECDYCIGKKKNLMVGVSMYYDRIRKEPKFVEVVAIYKEPR